MASVENCISSNVFIPAYKYHVVMLKELLKAAASACKLTKRQIVGVVVFYLLMCNTFLLLTAALSFYILVKVASESSVEILDNLEQFFIKRGPPNKIIF